ncbi:MAG: hypothetical protein JWP02_2649 [Acidimicrobiales bacterium]|nr:hypothetical protein [Acidimicrobiales bacterium]
MRRLVIALAVVVLLLVAGDFVAKAYATNQLRDRARAAVRGATSSSASITSFPFLGRLLVAGSVQDARVRVGPVVAGRVTFASVAVDLHDVRVDRNRLINEQKVRLTSIGSGTVTAELTAAEVSRLLGAPVSFEPGRVTVGIRGVSVSAPVSVVDSSLVLGGGQAPLRLKVPHAPLFPCDATQAVARQGVVEVSCTGNRVPPELVGSVSAQG